MKNDGKHAALPRIRYAQAKMKYQLQSYKNKTNLSEQSKETLQLINSTCDFRTIYNHVETQAKIEFETLQILRKGLLAGYASTIYTCNWKYEDELSLWKLVLEKTQEYGLGFLTLAQFSKSNETFEIWSTLLFKSFEIEPEHVFSLEFEEINELLLNEKTKYKMIDAWCNGFANNWNDSTPMNEKIEDFEYLTKRYKDDALAIELIKKYIN